MCCSPVTIGGFSKLWLTSALYPSLLLGQVRVFSPVIRRSLVPSWTFWIPKLAPEAVVSLSESLWRWWMLFCCYSPPVKCWMQGCHVKTLLVKTGETIHLPIKKELFLNLYSFSSYDSTSPSHLHPTCDHPKLLKRSNPRQQKKLDGENDFGLYWPIWRLFNLVCGGAIYQ